MRYRNLRLTLTLTKVQDVKDLMQRLIDAFPKVEESVIQNVIDNG